MFVWFVDHHGKTTAEDCNVNQQRMAPKWHPADGLDTLVLCLFTGTAFTGCTNFTMAGHNIVDIGLHVIKQCGMYAKEYKAWIARKAISPRIVMFDTLKTFWAAKITLVNQIAIPVSLHGYGMATVNKDKSVTSYSKLIANFGAVYATTQESVKTQGLMIVAMQGQLNTMTQYCMALQQQAPPTIYTPQQQQHTPNNHCGMSLCHGYNGGRGYQQPAYLQPGAMGQRTMQPPTPFKCFKN
jgi:hypothetical protein